jgi:hypothetical protein
VLAAGATLAAVASRGEPTARVSIAAILLVGSAAASGGWLLLAAGRLERRGRLGRSRRLARRAGFLLAAGAASLAATAWADLLFRPALRRGVLQCEPAAAVALASGLLLLGLATFCGLLAALSGKPRPTGTFAALCYLAGIGCLAGAAGLAALHCPS